MIGSHVFKFLQKFSFEKKNTHFQISRSLDLATLKNIWHIWEGWSLKVSMEEINLIFVSRKLVTCYQPDSLKMTPARTPNRLAGDSWLRNPGWGILAEDSWLRNLAEDSWLRNLAEDSWLRNPGWGCLAEDSWLRNPGFQALSWHVWWPTGLRSHLDSKMLIFYYKYWCLNSRPPVSCRRDESKCHQVCIFIDQSERRSRYLPFKAPQQDH